MWVIVDVVLVVFFFFKQKTAYEMRISDWSSDVCSSDLPRDAARVRHFAADRSERTLIHKGPADQAEIRVYWPARDDSDLAAALRLNLLMRAMQLELTEEMRERLGENYSHGEGAALSDEFTRPADARVGDERVHTWRSRWERVNEKNKTDTK